MLMFLIFVKIRDKNIFVLLIRIKEQITVIQQNFKIPDVNYGHESIDSL